MKTIRTYYHNSCNTSFSGQSFLLFANRLRHLICGKNGECLVHKIHFILPTETNHFTGKMSEDHAMASELIEHAILALETSFHSMFSLTAGYCRLDYRRQENRALFVTLFKHAQYLEGRACPRTALEVAKLILSFDPENDPLAMILVIDYFALRAQQYEWLIQLYEEWEITNNLSQLPNMAYSYAMALFYHHTDGIFVNTFAVSLNTDAMPIVSQTIR